MANKDDRLPDNAAGKWYVDSSCIDCDVCRTTAPNNFKANEDEGYSFVFKQPENGEEAGAVRGGQGVVPGRGDRRRRRVAPAVRFTPAAGLAPAVVVLAGSSRVDGAIATLA